MSLLRAELPDAGWHAARIPIGKAKAGSSLTNVQNNGRFYKDTQKRNFNGPVLAYVTPWNGKGYEVAKVLQRKFTHISPVWYQLKRSAGFYLSGQHDVNQDWIKQVKTTRPSSGSKAAQHLKIVPRVIFEMRPMDLIGSALSSPGDVLAILVAEALEQRFDGWVLEVWSQWAGLGLQDSQDLQEKIYSFIAHLAAGFHKEGLELILAVPPMVPALPKAPSFTPEDLKGVLEHVDSLSVMTYDHAKLGPGPNAPMRWIEANVEALKQSIAEAPIGQPGSKKRQKKSRLAAKVMLGLNLYGMDFTLSGDAAAAPIVGQEVIAKLRRYRPKLEYEESVAEHSFTYVTNSRSHKVYYPSLLSIEKRLHKAQEEGFGVSLWEIGQGLTFFYDLL